MFPDTQPEPALVQLKAITSLPKEAHEKAGKDKLNKIFGQSLSALSTLNVLPLRVVVCRL